MDQQTVKIRYVGLKPEETDCVGGTFIKWVGLGDVKDVPVNAWEKMKKHIDVWELVEDEPVPVVENANTSLSSVSIADAPIKNKGGRPRKVPIEMASAPDPVA